MFAYLHFGCIGLLLLNQRKMTFSSVITDGPEDSESSNSESFQAISAVKVEHFSKTRVRMMQYSLFVVENVFFCQLISVKSLPLQQ